MAGLRVAATAAEDWRTGALRTDWEEERGGSERSLVNVRCCRGHCGKLKPHCLTMPE